MFNEIPISEFFGLQSECAFHVMLLSLCAIVIVKYLESGKNGKNTSIYPVIIVVLYSLVSIISFFVDIYNSYYLIFLYLSFACLMFSYLCAVLLMRKFSKSFMIKVLIFVFIFLSLFSFQINPFSVPVRTFIQIPAHPIFAVASAFLLYIIVFKYYINEEEETHDK